MSKLNEVFNLLEVKPYQKFKIESTNGKDYLTIDKNALYYFTDTLCLYYISSDGAKHRSSLDIGCFFNDTMRIIPIKEITNLLTLEILSYLYEHGYRYIARDKDKTLWASTSYFHKENNCWSTHGDIGSLTPFSDLFDFISWEDTEPFEIPSTTVISSKKVEIFDLIDKFQKTAKR